MHQITVKELQHNHSAVQLLRISYQLLSNLFLYIELIGRLISLGDTCTYSFRKSPRWQIRLEANLIITPYFCSWLPAIQRQWAARGALFQVQAWHQQYPSSVPGEGNQLSALRSLEVVQRTPVAWFAENRRGESDSEYQFGSGSGRSAGGQWYQLGTSQLHTYNLWTKSAPVVWDPSYHRSAFMFSKNNDAFLQ